MLDGRKRATAGALWSYEAEDEPVPQVGDFSVITAGVCERFEVLTAGGGIY